MCEWVVQWVRFVQRVIERVNNHRLSLVAAGMAFYAILSIFPALTAIISMYGLVADPNDVSRQVAMLPANIPPALTRMIASQIQNISQGSGVVLSFGLVFSILFAVYSASKSTRALVMALNIAYDETDDRGLIMGYLNILALTLGGVFLVIGLLTLIGLSAYLHVAGLGYWPALIINGIRWVVMLALMTSALGMVYAFAPSRRRPHWHWLTPGAVIATLLWLGVSLAFSFYIGHFNNFNRIYGSAAAIMVLLMWFALSAFVVLIGAEINAEIEATATRRPEVTTPIAAVGSLRQDLSA